MFAVSIPLCNACLLAKAKHVAGVFKISSGINRVNDRSLGLPFQSFIQILFVLSITSLAIVIWLIFAIIDPPIAAYDYRYEQQVHVHCTTRSRLVLGLIITYSIVLASISTILA